MDFFFERTRKLNTEARPARKPRSCRASSIINCTLHNSDRTNMNSFTVTVRATWPNFKSYPCAFVFYVLCVNFPVFAPYPSIKIKGSSSRRTFCSVLLSFLGILLHGHRRSPLGMVVEDNGYCEMEWIGYETQSISHLISYKKELVVVESLKFFLAQFYNIK